MEEEKNKKIAEIREKIIRLKNKTYEVREQMNLSSYDDRRRYFRKLNEISEEIHLLENQILFIDGPEYNNKEIDLYLDKKSSTENEKCYLITLHGNLKEIGKVRVTLKYFSSYLGNIGYEVNPFFRGHKYALQSLELLKGMMIESGLTNPIITVYPDNLASVKTIQAFGGVLVKEHNYGQKYSYDTYEVDLLEKQETKKR